MVDSNPVNEEFGQPDTNYNDAPSLISAVHTYPRRFSPETREFVAKLAFETATPSQTKTDN